MPNYRPAARAAAQKYGVPPNIFAALITQESGWRPKAGSKAGAVGLTQIHLPSHPDVTYEQATNPAFALDWGARYLAAQYKRFGNWRSALAAYNAGPGRVEDGSWVRIPETANYVKTVLGNAGKVTKAAPAADPLTGMPTAPDMKPLALENLSSIAQGRFDPVAALTAQAQASRAARLAGQQGVAPAPTAPAAPANYSSTALGKIIGTPGAGTHTLGNWQSDNAYDVAVPEGTPIRADFDGVVGQNIGPLGKEGSRFAGSRVQIDGRGNSAWYGHLSRYVVKPGQRVKKGQIIGYSGSANGVPHLHVGYRVLPKGR